MLDYAQKNFQQASKHPILHIQRYNNSIPSNLPIFGMNPLCNRPDCFYQKILSPRLVEI
jgi:hypothetical protein